VTAREALALTAIAVLACLVTFALPARTAARIQRLRERIAADPRVRLRFYLRYLAIAAVTVLLSAAVVALGGGGLDRAGLTWGRGSSWRYLVVGLVAVATLDALLLTTMAVAKRRDPAALDKAKQYERIGFLIPGRAPERALWPLVALAIAVQEEAVFRGLFLLYAAHLLGISPWWLVLPVSVSFALGHRYQGWLGVASTGAIGVAFGILTVGLVTLWPAVLLHAVFDARLMFVRPPAPATPSPGAGTVPPQPPPG
jgi:membrane protease YdiL (CAAX protease family)